MTRRIVGLDIGSTSVRAVEIEHPDSARPKVLRRREAPLPATAARFGEVIDAEAVAEVLRGMWRAGEFRSKKVVLGIGGQRMMARELTVPRVPLRRIRETLPFQVQDLLPVPVDDLLLDFYPTEEVVSEGARMVAGLLVAALKDTVRVNIRAVELAGLVPVEVDILPFALTRAFRADLDTDGVVAMVEVGASATSVVVTRDRVPRFIRIVPRGGADLTERLAERLDIEPVRAERVKLGLANGFDGQDVPDYLVEAALIVETYQRDVLQGLRNTLGYYASTSPEAPIERIVLTGGGARMTGFTSALQTLSGIPVERGNPYAGVRASRTAALDTDPEDHTHAVALGLALGSTR